MSIMKRLLAFSVCAVISVALLGCGNTGQKENPRQQQGNQPTQQESQWNEQKESSESTRERQNSSSEESGMNQPENQSGQNYDYQSSPPETGENE